MSIDATTEVTTEKLIETTQKLTTTQKLETENIATTEKGPSILRKNINDNINNNKVPDFTVNEEACNKTIKTQSSYKYWTDDANKKRKAHKNFDTPRNTNKAKNIILFIGDGMNIDSVTGGRIEAGREKSFMNGVGCGEEY